MAILTEVSPIPTDIDPTELLVHVDSVLELILNACDNNINRTASVALLLKDIINLMEE